jgi:hypothetical protein
MVDLGRKSGEMPSYGIVQEIGFETRGVPPERIKRDEELRESTRMLLGGKPQEAENLPYSMNNSPLPSGDRAHLQRNNATPPGNSTHQVIITLPPASPAESQEITTLRKQAEEWARAALKPGFNHPANHLQSGKLGTTIPDKDDLRAAVYYAINIAQELKEKSTRRGEEPMSDERIVALASQAAVDHYTAYRKHVKETALELGNGDPKALIRDRAGVYHPAKDIAELEGFRRGRDPGSHIYTTNPGLPKRNDQPREYPGITHDPRWPSQSVNPGRAAMGGAQHNTRHDPARIQQSTRWR